jgi:hypothetical protein
MTTFLFQQISLNAFFGTRQQLFIAKASYKTTFVANAFAFDGQ